MDGHALWDCSCETSRRGMSTDTAAGLVSARPGWRVQGTARCLVVMRYLDLGASDVCKTLRMP